MSKSVVKKSENAVADLGAMFEGMAGVGLENVTASDLIIPRLALVQKLSEVMQRSKTEYNPDAKEGDIQDVGMQDLFSDGIAFLPVLFRKEYLEWHPRASGKGLAAVHPSDSRILSECQPDEKGRPTLASGNYVAETLQMFGLNLSAGNRRCFISMASTQRRKMHTWLSLSSSEKIERADGTEFTPPLFYRTYSVGTQFESNDQGEWVGWKIERGPSLPDMGEEGKKLLASATEFYKAIRAGEVKADPKGAQPMDISSDDVPF